MRTLSGFCLALLVASTLSAQGRSGFVQPLPGIMTSGSVVHPGGSSSLPGVQRTTGSVVNPGGSTPQIGYPGLRWQGMYGQRPQYRNGHGTYAYPVAVPIYVGGYGYGYGYDAPPAQAPAAPAQATPNVIVIYPPASGTAAAPADYTTPGTAPAQPGIIEVPQQDTQAQAPSQQDQGEATHYLIAFKDHSIYSAVAYWVEGDTLHYFTSGNTHNQVSVSLVDRELTKRLNEGSGLEVKLPPAK